MSTSATITGDNFTSFPFVRTFTNVSKCANYAEHYQVIKLIE